MLEFVSPKFGLAVLIVTLGITVQASVGFGLALIAAPLLYLIDPLLVPAPLIMTAWTLSLWIVWKDWREIELANFKAALAGRLIGSPLAALVIGSVSTLVFDAIFGVLVLVAVGMSMLHPKLQPTVGNVFLATIASGFMGTISGIGGPPLALVYQNVKGPSLRANLAMLFLIGTSLSLILLAMVGLFGKAQFQAGIVLHLGVLVGIFLSAPLRKRLDKRNVRPMLLGLCALSAAVVLGRALLQIL